MGPRVELGGSWSFQGQDAVATLVLDLDAADPWARVRAFLEAHRGRDVVGLLTYDAGRLVERVPTLAADTDPMPVMIWHAYAGAAASARDPSSHMRPHLHAPQPTLSEKGWESMVLAAKSAVREGEVFQVNLSHRLEADVGDADPRALYARLTAANPAPFRAYFESGPLPDGAPFVVLSSSPELLFELSADGTLRAKPIAGTRPRHEAVAEDARLARELHHDPKEQAEHVMLVDLARNDLGRVAAFGSVHVPRLADVESYRTVHHLVSTVEAKLAPGKDVVDAIVALFPGGTITGAPKPRAMELIERIEPVRRGVYTGSIVHVRPDGSAVANILIRTMVLRAGKLHVQVGAGIVEESVPHREWDETMAKAEGMLRALRGDP